MTGQEGRVTVGAGIVQEPDVALEAADQQMKVRANVIKWIPTSFRICGVVLTCSVSEEVAIIIFVKSTLCFLS